MARVASERSDAVPVKCGYARVLYVCAGCVSVALGAIGTVVPGMPTTVFLIVASYFFARSSPALDAWLHRNRLFGPSLSRFHETGGMPRRAKVIALAAMWSAISVSVVILAGVSPIGQAVALALGLVGTITLVWVVRTTTSYRGM